jgi:hypothetical protein
VPGTPTTEICNATDDDCDGQVDEASATLCAATGQTCSAGTCVCPSGQSVCGSSCVTLGGSCSAGVGACLRQGSNVCVSGGVACDAVAGSPTAEVCDGVDNNCNGTIDEGVTVTCNVDADNDGRAVSGATSTQCRDSSRAAAGFCPAGFVAPANSAGLDCNDNNGSVYQFVNTYADVDADFRCAGQETTICVGAVLPLGRRLSSACLSTSDCNDSNANLWITYATRADADNDGYCTGAVSNTCNSNSPAPGRRNPGDCNSVNDDCNDTVATQFTSRLVRPDTDNDGWCSNVPASIQCGGNAPNPGTRLATACLGTDCSDVNNAATDTCILTGRYSTDGATKQCGIGIPSSETKSVNGVSFCPPGFRRFGPARVAAKNGDPGGSCTPFSDVGLTMACGNLVFGNFTCALEGDCVAN